MQVQTINHSRVEFSGILDASIDFDASTALFRSLSTPKQSWENGTYGQVQIDAKSFSFL